MANSVDDFKSKLTGGGARPNLFRVECTFPAGTNGNTELASFLIKSASLPAATQGTIEVPFRGRKFKIPGDRVYDQWTVKVINDIPMNLRNAFENWIDITNPPRANTGATFFGAYMTQLKVWQLDKAGNEVKGYQFIDCYPVTVGAIELNYDSNDAIEEFDVTFNYQYWLSNTTVYPGGGNGGGIGSVISSLKSGIANAAGAAVSGAINNVLGGR